MTSPIQSPRDTWRAEGLRESFQSRVAKWMDACFGPAISADKIERNHRFLEEALELVQACGCSQSEAHQLVDYVYGRDQGDINQEIGGVMVTLAALCLANNFNMHGAGETELARVWTKIEKIRAKQAAKPKHSPLPEAIPSPPIDPEASEVEAVKQLRQLVTIMDERVGHWLSWKRGAEHKHELPSHQVTFCLSEAELISKRMHKALNSAIGILDALRAQRQKGNAESQLAGAWADINGVVIDNAQLEELKYLVGLRAARAIGDRKVESILHFSWATRHQGRDNDLSGGAIQAVPGKTYEDGVRNCISACEDIMEVCMCAGANNIEYGVKQCRDLCRALLTPTTGGGTNG